MGHHVELTHISPRNPRRKVPSVDGARIPTNNPGNAPCRIMSTSSIESAPATIPATIEATFIPGFAAPVPAETGSRTRWSATSCKPARSASRSTGTTPAHNTRSDHRMSLTPQQHYETLAPRRCPPRSARWNPRQVSSSQLRGHLLLSDTPSHRTFTGGSRLRCTSLCLVAEGNQLHASGNA